eukprot:3763905-Pleurochrysis_carterae.AAC.1
MSGARRALVGAQAGGAVLHRRDASRRSKKLRKLRTASGCFEMLCGQRPRKGSFYAAQILLAPSDETARHCEIFFSSLRGRPQRRAPHLHSYCEA